MASSSGNSSGSTQLQNSASEEELQHVMDQRKRKRMQSNRESARRSRMRKQKHLDDLMAQVAELSKENSEILSSINEARQRYLAVEADNSILRAQAMELTRTFHSLSDILDSINPSTPTTTTNGYNGYGFLETGDLPMNALFDPFFSTMNLNYLCHNHPIIASADVLPY